MNILLIGQCTLHWGRMEFGNIGNFYIMEPFIRQLHETFPGCTIRTTFQMSESFCSKERVSVLPMELYYGWSGNDLDAAMAELSIAKDLVGTDEPGQVTPYITEVMKADLVIDFSGDIWGDNADLLGPDRFIVGLCKNRVAQLLGKRTVMLAGSPGPFGNEKNLAFAKEVFENFDLVTNREPLSRHVLESYGFDTSRTKDLACPSFLFKPAEGRSIDDLVRAEGLVNDERPTVGFILCGWNFIEGPFDKWPRSASEYEVFAEAVEMIERKLDARVCLMSHSNGFPVPPEPFELLHGRDYPVVKQLQSILSERGRTKHVFALDGVYDAWTTKAIIGKFDMLVSGRIHAAVAGISQCVPTVIIDYGHEPKAHKLKGFAAVTAMEEYVADPSISGDMERKVEICWLRRPAITEMLTAHIPTVQEKAKENFRALDRIMALGRKA